MTKHTPTPWQLAARKYEERHHDGRPAAVVLPVPVVREEGCLMDKSTPRPWHTEGSVVADYGYNPIAQMRQPAGQTEIDNAALIVRAVNSHDALVAALTDWLYYAAQCLSEFDLEDCGQEPLCARCEVAGCINRKIRNARAALVAAQPKGSE